MPPFLVSLLLAAHGLVHACYAQPAPPAKAGAPAWPFYLDHSWLLTPAGLDAKATRAVGLALLAVVVAGYAGSALTVLGVAPGAWFVPTTMTASIASAAMLALFFTPWILFGLLIDVVLVAAVLVADWKPGAVA